jgi:hypothetical protein
MGGAIAAHVRAKDKFFIQAAIPIIIWVGFGLVIRVRCVVSSVFDETLPSARASAAVVVVKALTTDDYSALGYRSFFSRTP